jgi:ribosomal protein S18 acetylase RimI-like enzyme
MRPSLRPAAKADLAFMMQLYASTRAAELALVPWDGATKRSFVEHQFTAQDLHYRRQHPDARFDVVEVDGERAGRLVVDRRDEAIHIVDIALLPEFRGRGIGTLLLRSLLEEADTRGVKASMTSERTNAALRLYRRLGFVPIADDGVYLTLERPPAAESAA